MAHQIYLTEGIILKKKDFGEADRLFYIYTEKFGMIMASAQGVRSEKSKLRGNLGLFAYGDFAVISSKDFWRLVDSRETLSPKLKQDSAEPVKIFAKTAELVMRMVKGEEKNEELWNQLKDLFLKLFSARNEKNCLSKNELMDLEIKSAAVILKILGYMDKTPVSQKDLISAVNRAIKESML